jgi:16S rRNA (cytidine1402-2'-O)-methyltransferase
VSGKLILCGTPIGNLEDLSPRAIRVLSEADIVACEDTRRTRKLLSHYGLTVRKLVTHHDSNERRSAPELVRLIAAGNAVVLVSDSGMPGLSDPGYRLVRACIDSNLPVEVVPGPSAGVSALAVSGLPPARYVFEGFLPRKSSDRRRRIEEIATDQRTLVIFESPHRVAECLADLLEVLGDRPACLARELTKLHEEVRRGPISELLTGLATDPARGEIVVVVGGAVHAHKQAPSSEDLAGRATALMEDGVARKDALSEVARVTGVSRREVFDALVNWKQKETDESG